MTSRAKTSYSLIDQPLSTDDAYRRPDQLELQEPQPVEHWPELSDLRVVAYGTLVAYCYIVLLVLFGFTNAIFFALAISATCLCVTVVMLVNSRPR